MLPTDLLKNFLKSLKYTPPFLKMYVHNINYKHAFFYFLLTFEHSTDFKNLVVLSVCWWSVFRMYNNMAVVCGVFTKIFAFLFVASVV